LYEWSRGPVEKVIVNQQYVQFLTSMDNEQQKIHQAVRLLEIIFKDHHLLAFGKPPEGFAYTEAEISQDIILINKMITELIQLMK
jgi:23S rRNA-/tRNA-specific pseudouridylate synthase